MSQAFHCRPSDFFGFNSSDDDTWFAYQIDRAVFTFGSFVQARIEETIEVPVSAKPKKKNTEIKQKYSREQIQETIYGPLPDRAPTNTPNEPNMWGNIDPYAVEIEQPRHPAARRTSGRKILPHEVTN